MDNKIMKYEESFLGRIIRKIKTLFFKNKTQEKESIKEIADEQKTINNEEAKQKFIELVRKFNAREIQEKDLTAEEIEQLTKYYEDRDKELDKEIASQKRILENLNMKLNRLSEKAISFKA
jgi:hypothetical protein